MGLNEGVPHAHDCIAAWFEPLLSARLAQAGFGTLEQLIQHINATGENWWYPVRGVGTARAARIVEWLQSQHGSTGMQVKVRDQRDLRIQRGAQISSPIVRRNWAFFTQSMQTLRAEASGRIHDEFSPACADGQSSE